MISNINYVKKILGDLKAKKKFGQNFLIDENVVDKIARIACDERYKTIEIGPGLGALTEKLLIYSSSVDAYEIDKDMFERLSSSIDDERLNIYLQDFLDTDLSIYTDKVNICGNLPYYVTTPILFKIIESDLDINKITIMVQKEVGDRIVSKADDEEYGALSVEIQYLYDVKMEMNVSRSVFYPSPNVDSVIISLTPNRKIDKDIEKGFFEFVKNCFRMRRKTLYNNLKDIYVQEKIENMYLVLNIDKNIRAQQLPLNEFINIYRILV